MKTKLLFTTLVTAAVILAQPPAGRGGRMGFGPGPMGPGGPDLHRTVTGAPYSGVETRIEQQVLANGNTIQRQTQTTIHRDSQGRVRTETEMTRPNANGQSTTVKRISISDPVSGYVHEIDPQNKTVTSMALRAAGPNGRRPGGPGPGFRNGQGPSPRMANGATRQADPNLTTENLGTQTINGIQATGTRMTRTIPAGAIGNTQPIQIVHETWMSEDLKVPVMIKTTDPRFGTTVTQLTNINRAEPDAALFQPPSDYTVRQGGPGGRGMGRPAPRPIQ